MKTNNKISIHDALKHFYSSKESFIYFETLPDMLKGRVLYNLNHNWKKKIISKLSDSKLILYLEFLDPDEITDILQVLSKNHKNRILTSLSERVKEKVEYLLSFDPTSAAGIMSLDYILVNFSDPILEIKEQIKIHIKRTGKSPAVLVEDEESNLLGEVPIFKLIGNKSYLSENDIDDLLEVAYNEKKEIIFELFKTNPYKKILVQDDEGQILGVIYMDDVLPLIHQSKDEKIFRFASVNENENTFDSIFSKVKHRSKWLMLNLIIGFFIAFIIGFFEKTIASYVFIAAYMPVIAAIAGGAGTQALAVVVRGMSLKEIASNSDVKKIIFKEFLTGFLNGVLIGFVMGSVLYILNKNLLFSLIIFLSMIINLSLACFFGVIIPLIMNYFGKDPATSASIFITTLTDVFGFCVFLGLASIFL
jgi:magnesium transporter